MGIGKAQCGNVKNFDVANFLREIKLIGRSKIDFTKNLITLKFLNFPHCLKQTHFVLSGFPLKV